MILTIITTIMVKVDQNTEISSFQFSTYVGVNGLGCGLRIKKIAPIIKEKTPKHGMTRHI